MDGFGLIQLSLELLRKNMVEEEISMGIDKETNELLFFKTRDYLDGKPNLKVMRVSISSLVK